ncbi:hypothetical protein CgunFtcFv8_023149 [Champsocephalus gunnari]|uniref:Selenoprotein P N-terminal domain-containing protein n=1 Tax=Champsocephalus gunnari TaxID=52237 RepID=A0AAN8DJW0_CHAGU|nr:hypothetical protein CgunFtcFv8_023149 [Champsocephalus gunnari]
MSGVSSLWLYAALPGLLWAAHASKIGGLRDKLNRSNLTDVSFMIVNERDAMSRAMYWELKRKAALGVPVYQQGPLQDDVWEALDGDKDDFLIYDRCGLLTFHIVLPYSFLHKVYVEAAIRATYLKNICNCTANHTLSSGKNTLMKNETTQFNVSQTTTIPTSPPPSHHHHNGPHHHHHQHDHTSPENLSKHQHSQNNTLHPPHHHPEHHHYHPHYPDHHHQHHHQQPGNHSHDEIEEDD